MSTTDIVTYPQRIGTTDYLPADKIDIHTLLTAGLLNERLVDQMRDQQKISAATPECFRMAAARRPQGSPWPPRGFTEAYLVESGLIDPPAPKARAAAPAEAAKGKKPAPEKERITHIELTSEAIQVGGYRLQPTKRGNFVFWCATDADGKILRDALFKNMGAGTAFLEDLLFNGPGAGTPGPAEKSEAKDGGDVRSGPDDAEG